MQGYEDGQVVNYSECCQLNVYFVSEEAPVLTLNIPSLSRQRCLPSWGPRRTPRSFFVIYELFVAVDYSNYVLGVSETIIQ
jgi:hypothetical protein